MTDDCIYRDDAVSRISELLVSELHMKRCPTWNEVYNAIGELPSADVVQVVHAYWIQTSAEDEDGNAYYSCSNCGSGESHNPIVEVPYCWKCGAKMDGGNYDSLHN